MPHHSLPEVKALRVGKTSGKLHKQARAICNIKPQALACFSSLWLLTLGSIARTHAEHPFGLDINHPYGRLTTAYVTPHVKWANPYYRGKTRILVIAPTWSQRETIELAQRLSVDFTPWMCATFRKLVEPAHFDPAFSFFQAPPEVVQRAGTDALKKEHDVVIVGKMEWSAIPAKQRFELLRRVSEGTGFVYVNPPKDDRELELVFSRHAAPEGVPSITGNLPLAALPRFQGIDRDKLVTTFRFGKGRVVVLDYQQPLAKDEWETCAAPCLTPQWEWTDPKDGFKPVDTLPEAEFVPYEYYQALVARAVLWAAKKQSEVKLKSILLDEKMTWPVKGKQITIELSDLPAGALARASIRSRIDGKTLPIGEREAADQVIFPLPDIPAGNYFVDVWILSNKKDILTWGSRSFSVSTDSPFGDIPLDRRAYNRGDRVGGSVTLTRPLTKKESAVVSLWDNYGRCVEIQPCRAKEDNINFRFGPLRPLTSLYRVEVKLLRAGAHVFTVVHNFPVRARLGWDDFNEIVWSGGENNFLTHLMLRKLSAQDETSAIDIGWRGCTNARNIALANLASVPYTARYGCLDAGADHVVPEDPKSAYGCMSSPVTFANLDEWGEVQSDMYGPYGPLAWTHGDETNYSVSNPNLCWSKTCLAAFRKYLQGVYPDLSSLNKEWGTTFSVWEEVMPLTLKEAKETKAYARWVEHRLSANRVFAEFYRRSGEALSKHDPGARAGFDGGVGLKYPNSGGDWWTLSQNIAILHSYIGDSAQMEMFRSFARPEQVRGMWYGTYGRTWQVGPNTVPYCHFFPWYSIFHQLNTTWFWTMGNPGPLSGYAPDLTSLPFFAARTEALRQIRSGIGKLLLTSMRCNDGIAIHHSETSRVADSLFAAKESDWSTGYEQAVASFNKALEDCGLQYQYVATQEIEAGALKNRRYKVLMMPHSHAVSDAEAKMIRQFVEDGGVVVADILPGTLNGHGTPQPQSMLAHLFPSDKPETITQVGKGKSILLGGLLRGYSRAHMDMFGWKRLPLEKSQHFAKLLRNNANISPQVKIISPRGEKMPPTEVSRFQNGSVEFIGLLREYFLYDNDTYPARIEFPRVAHIYDVIEGKYLGYTDRVDTDLSFRARLFALSPYKVKGLALTLPRTAVAGQPTPLRIATQTEGNLQPTRHCFRLEVISPGGKSLTHYAQNLLADKGFATLEIHFALNDSAGLYAVRIKDVMSGVVERRCLLLKSS